MRAMSPNSDFDTYHKYKVTKELPVRKGTIQGWFSQPGGGTQYMLDPDFVAEMKVKCKKDQGIIDLLKEEGYLELIE